MKLRTLWIGVRSVFAVVAGIFAMTLIAFAIELPLQWLVPKIYPQGFPDQSALQTSTVWMLSQALYGVPATIFGGYVAAWLAPYSKFGHAMAMAIVQELLIAALMLNPPHPVPAWMWALTLTLTPAAIIYGGYLCAGWGSKTARAEPRAAPKAR